LFFFDGCKDNNIFPHAKLSEAKLADYL